MKKWIEEGGGADHWGILVKLGCIAFLHFSVHWYLLKTNEEDIFAYQMFYYACE